MSDDDRRPSAPLPVWTRSGLVAGIGLRAAASPDDILKLLDSCLATAGAVRSDLLAIATRHTRADHPALASVAARLSVPLVALPMEGQGTAVPNPSLRVAQLAGLPSVAEAAAMHFGPLVLAKQQNAVVTCALSRYVPAGSAASSNASSAASMLATSSAGP